MRFSYIFNIEKVENMGKTYREYDNSNNQKAPKDKNGTVLDDVLADFT